jgi:predicted enzyme related to lactoylglutathione lyase
MFKAIQTGIYVVDDMEKGKAWYSKVLGNDPYYDQEFYAGYRVGDKYELGLLPKESGFEPGAGGSITYWHVDNIEKSVGDILSKGATKHDAITDVGDGIKVASVKDPFGNIIGLIEDKNFKL